MAYKQPRVPQKQPGMSQEEYLRALTLFLKDFCMETWTAVTRGKKDGDKEIRITTVNGEGPDEGGNVQLSAGDVGARPDSWTPNAGDVGALPADGTAKDSERLGGVLASAYMLKSGMEMIQSPFTLHPKSPAWVTWFSAQAGTMYQILEWTVEKTGKYILFLDWTFNFSSPDSSSAFNMYLYKNLTLEQVSGQEQKVYTFWQQNAIRAQEARWPIAGMCALDLQEGDYLWFGFQSENQARNVRLLLPENTAALYLGE